MAKKKPTKAKTTIAAKKGPHPRALPGLEDRTIKPLEDVAEEYADIRDNRVELTAREHALKIHALQLMKKYDRVIYRHDGIEITVVPGEDDIKVKVKKESDDADDTTDGNADVADIREGAADTE